MCVCVCVCSLRAAMGKVTVFTVDDCPHCTRAKRLLDDKGVQYDCISLSLQPEWKNLLYVLTNGRTSVPQIFLNKDHIGGADELYRLEEEGKLSDLLQKASSEECVDFPPSLRHPSGEEFLQASLLFFPRGTTVFLKTKTGVSLCKVQVIPEELRIKWQTEVEALDAKLGGAPDKPISSLLLMLEAPEEMVIVCTAGMWPW